MRSPIQRTMAITRAPCDEQQLADFNANVEDISAIGIDSCGSRLRPSAREAIPCQPNVNATTHCSAASVRVALPRANVSPARIRWKCDCRLYWRTRPAPSQRRGDQRDAVRDGECADGCHQAPHSFHTDPSASTNSRGSTPVGCADPPQIGPSDFACRRTLDRELRSLRQHVFDLARSSKRSIRTHSGVPPTRRDCNRLTGSLFSADLQCSICAAPLSGSEACDLRFALWKTPRRRGAHRLPGTFHMRVSPPHPSPLQISGTKTSAARECKACQQQCGKDSQGAAVPVESMRTVYRARNFL